MDLVSEMRNDVLIGFSLEDGGPTKDFMLTDNLGLFIN